MSNPSHPHRSAVAFALNLLAHRPSEYAALKDETLALVQTEHGGFTGDLAPLNVLVEYGRSVGVDALDTLWTLVESRIGYEDKSRADRAAYQASYMAQRRARVRNALALYEKLHACKLSAEDRRSIGESLHNTWMLWRNEVLAGARPGDERNEVTRLFWSDIDDQIQAGLAGDHDVAHRVLAEQKV